MNQPSLVEVHVMNIPMETEPIIIDMYTSKEMNQKKKEQIPKYPKFEKKGDYIVGLGHIWKLMKDINPIESLDNYIYIGEDLWQMMK